MAKKINIISQVCLGILTVLTLGYAANYSPVYACGGEDSEELNCTETTEESGESAENPLILISSNPSREGYGNADSKIESQETVPHSRFLAGNEIKSEDSVKGIEFLAGNLVGFSGNAEYGFFAGNSLSISGKIENDLFVAGNAVEITDDAMIGRDLFAAGETVLIKTNLNGNAFVGGGRVVLENVTIDGDLNIAADEIIIKGKSSIGGKLSYNDDAKITGFDELSVSYVEAYKGSSASKTTVTTNIILAKIETTIFFLLGRLIVTIIIVAIASKFSKKLLDDFELKSSWKDLALGLGLLLFVPLAAIFVMITLVGLPLGIVTIVFYGLIAYFAKSITGGIVGDLLNKHLLKKEKLPVLAKYAIGTTIVVLAGLIPVLGGLISAIAACFGFGYFVHNLFRKEAKKAKK